MPRILLTVLLLANAYCAFADDIDLKSPVHFKNYEELFTYIASQNGLETDSQSIFHLAVDSQIDYQYWPEINTNDQRAAIIIAMPGTEKYSKEFPVKM